MGSEHAWNPDWVMKPGEHLLDSMNEDGITHEAVASACGLTVETIDGVLDASVTITTSIARGLAQGTGIPDGIWLNLERIYRDGLASGKKEI